MTYRPKRSPNSRTVVVRKLEYHLTSWGDPSARSVLLLHGFMDTGSSFQFLADAMHRRWHLIAPDWRGFGKTEWCPYGYWFPDYLADLEALLDVLGLDESVDLVGHSMGANVASLYAGIRPERVRHLANLEGFGLPDSSPDDAPGRYRDWLERERTGGDFISYASLETLAERLQKKNPRLDNARALFLAGLWAKEEPDGRARLRADPAHRLPNPVLYRREEAQACWRAISARAMFVRGSESHFAPELPVPELGRSAGGYIERVVPDSGHMLHHDQPALLADCLEEFLSV